MNFFNFVCRSCIRGKGFFVMFFGWGKDFLNNFFVNISSPVPSINNVQSLTTKHFIKGITMWLLSSCPFNKVDRHKLIPLYIYHFSTVVDFSSEKSVALLNTETPGTSREIYSEDADDGTRTHNG